MSLRFVSVYKVRGHEKLLYALLKERPASMNISHRRMPSFAEHRRFVRSKPYKEWFWVQKDGETVGSVYLSRQNEIGIFFFKKFRKKKLQIETLRAFITQRRKLRLLANVSPKNKSYAGVFRSLGFKVVQHSYCLESR